MAGGAAKPKKSPALTDQARDLKALRDVVVDAATVSSGLWFSYVFVLLYLLIAIGGVTHRNLFFEDPVKLPFLNVDLPLVAFFVLGPALFLIVHAYVLLHFVLFAGKVGVFHAQLQVQIPNEEVRAQLRWQLPSNIFVQILAGTREVRRGVTGHMLRLVAQISLVAAPLALLLLFQIQFLPYHPAPTIAFWLRVTVLIDLVLLWTLWPSVARGKMTSIAWRDFHRARAVPVALLVLVRTLWRCPWVAPYNKPVRIAWWVLRRVAERGIIVAAAIASLIPILLVFTISTYPSEWLDNRLRSVPVLRTVHELLFAGAPDEVSGRPRSLFSNRLVLTDQGFFDSDKLDKVKVSSSFRGRDLREAVFNRADLREADFTGAMLDGASLEGAKLQNARFSCAYKGKDDDIYGQLKRVPGWPEDGCTWLQGASLIGAQLQGAQFGYARLNGADFRDAQLQGAKFDNAQLQRANFFEVDLPDVSLSKANLQDASLRNALLRGARLDGAQLQRANLIGASLQGAHLNDALLQEASLYRAQLQGAYLWKADLRDANLVFANIEGANLDYADMRGASLGNAHLERASLRKSNLQGASLDHAYLMGANLFDAQLQGAELNSTVMWGASLEAAALQGAWLIYAYLQGASLDGAHLEGARLNNADLRGASLENARLQGASLDQADLQGASLENALVWRAHSGVNLDLTERNNIDPNTKPWEDTKPWDARYEDWSTFAAWRDSVLKDIPKDHLKGDSSSFVLSGLDPALTVEPKNVIDWGKVLPVRQFHGEELASRLSAFLSDLACSSFGTGEVGRGLLQNGRIKATGLHVASFAERLRSGQSNPVRCLGVEGFTDKDWVKLDELVAATEKSLSSTKAN